jgi:serine/threonine-protein kinase
MYRVQGADMAIAVANDFIDMLGRYALLEPAQLDEAAQLAARTREPRLLAAELIRRDWLTPYQANQIFQGKAAELCLGPYLTLERLGAGGMGQVFKALHRALQRIVALKILHPKLLDNEVAVRRFLREVRAAGQLSHPNIVCAYDAQQIDGRYYFAMEYIRGTDLARLVKEGGPLAVPRACDYVRQAALGLQHACERGLVHRDIKPHNLLVTRNNEAARHAGPSGLCGRWGVVKILDMGLARLDRQDATPASTELTKLGMVMGTPDYIAPEQARDASSCDTRSDLYSLGCTFYYLLAGQVPFPNGTMTERLLHHQLDEPEPVEEVRRRVLCQRSGNSKSVKLLAPGIAKLVRWLMAKKPEDRPQQPADLVRVLDDLFKSASSSAAVRRAGAARTIPAPPHPAVSPGQPTPPPRKAVAVAFKPPPLPPALATPAPAPVAPAAPPPTAKTVRRGGLRRKFLKPLVYAGIALVCLALGKGLWHHRAAAPASSPSTSHAEKARP